jgi:carboxymethylenebutenolidase
MPVQWNQFDTAGRDGMVCEVIDITGHNGETINAYYARPTGDGPFPAMVLVHHLPGWDEFYREMTRRFAQHGYLAICPNLYGRFGFGTPDDAAAKARGAGGVTDDQVLGDMEGAAKFLRSQSNCNGKVGIIGTCSGGRHALMCASRSSEFDAVADLWGGGVVQPEPTPQRPKAVIDMTADLNVPLLGLFGNDDQNPSPEQVNQHEEELKKHGKNYEFHRYDGAGHGFFYYQAPAYRQEAAMDGWSKVFTFFEKNLA